MKITLPSGLRSFKIAALVGALALLAGWGSAADKITTSDGLLTTAWGIRTNDEVLAITGLRRSEEIRIPEDHTRLTSGRFLRPEKPEEIVATITTSDGRKWRARWEETK